MANTYIRLNIQSGGGTDDKKVKVSSDDSFSGFLEEKVISGSDKLTTTVINPGLTERLELDVDQTRIDHDQLLNFDESEHKPLNDAATSADSLWSSQKIQNELDTKVDKVSSTDNALSKFDGIEGQVQDTGIIVDDLNNVTGINDLTIDGDLTVNGNTTAVNSQTLDVEDANISVNKGGDQATADLEGSGITVTMSDATDAQIAYDSSLQSKFKVGEVGSESEIVTTENTQVLENKTIDATSATGTNTITMDSNDVVYDNSISGLSSTNAKTAIDELDSRLDTAETNIQNISGDVLNVEEIYQATKEPTGFETRSTSTVTFDDVTHTLTIAPVSSSFTFYVKGVKYTKTSAESIQINNVLSGNHYFYYNENGVLSTTQVADQTLFTDNALVSIVYWNPEINQHIYFAEERHGLQMDGATHGYLHTTFGARYLSGHALQNFTIGDASLDSHAQFTADGGTIRDEDLVIQSPAQTQIPILYRQGSLWRKKTADSFPMIYSGTAGYAGTNIPYNEFNGVSWQFTEAPDNNYVLVHFFATNDKDTPIVGIQGIETYNNAPDARDAATTEISSLSGIPFIEFVAIGTVILQTSSSYGNSVKAKVEPIGSASYIDFRGTQLYTPAGEATTHSLLSGLTNDDHLQYHNDARADQWLEVKYPNDVYENNTILQDNMSLQTATGIFVNGSEVNAIFGKFVIVRGGVSEVVEITGSSVQSSSAWDYVVERVGADTGIELLFLNDQVYYTSTSTGNNATLTYRISVLGAN